MVQPADVVRTVDGDEFAVVDIAEIETEDDHEYWAILRPVDILYPDRFPPAVRVENLTVIGHLDDIPGWQEVDGKWVKDDS